MTKTIVSKKLRSILPKHSGRDSQGHVSIRHQGGRHKRFFRQIDFKRNKRDVLGIVTAIEYDPNRSARIALILYPDGNRRYILAPSGLVIGQKVLSAISAEISPGNALMAGNVPLGTLVHNIELIPGQGAKMLRSAGVAATILAKEGNFVHVKLPSGETRKISSSCWVSVGQVGREEWRTLQIGSAGRARHMGKRPEVRGVAQDPRSHPHGGGEGRSGIGMKSPKSPWGKRTLGKKTRKHSKYSDKYIIQRRKSKSNK
jgi:large subunit ribosomal protein L2